MFSQDAHRVSTTHIFALAKSFPSSSVCNKANCCNSRPSLFVCFSGASTAASHLKEPQQTMGWDGYRQWSKTYHTTSICKCTQWTKHKNTRGFNERGKKQKGERGESVYRLKSIHAGIFSSLIGQISRISLFKSFYRWTIKEK